jgi:hypothetical protein
MGKMYMGNIPDASEGWDEMDKFMDKDNVQWLMFSKKQDHNQDWWTIKIAAKGRASTKANYWLAINVRTGQLGFSRDYVLMRENRPELHSQIETIFKTVQSKQALT